MAAFNLPSSICHPLRYDPLQVDLLRDSSQDQLLQPRSAEGGQDLLLGPAELPRELLLDPDQAPYEDIREIEDDPLRLPHRHALFFAFSRRSSRTGWKISNITKGSSPMQMSLCGTPAGMQ